jgi:hypothetical protein
MTQATTLPTPTSRPRGRPALPAGEGKTARIEWRTTDKRKTTAQALADAAGISLSAWLDQRVDKSPGTKNV